MKKKTIDDLKHPEQITHLETVSKPHFSRRLIFFRIFLIIVATALVVLTFFAKKDPYFSFDLKITQAIQSFHPFWFDVTMNFITQLGNPIPGPILIVSALLLLIYKRRFKDTVMLALSTVGGFALSELLKTYVSRARPSPSLINQIGHFTRNDSFPSGHVLFFISFFGFLLFLSFTHLAKNIYRQIIISVLVSLLILIGPSRIYEGAHWFSDVTGAYLIGLLWLAVVITIYGRLNPKPKKD